MKLFFVAVFALALISCGKHTEPGATGAKDPNAAPLPNEADIVVKARATMVVTTEMGHRYQAFGGANGTQPVTVTLAPNTTFALDSTKFVVPAMSNAALSFGSLAVSSLTDNNLKTCGTAGTTKCGTALIRTYTTGVAGAGLWNTADGYGAPMTAALTTPLTVGLNVAAAATMQTFAIPATKWVMHLTDFTAVPKYNIAYDFTNAGAGSYSTTIVVEYALAP